MRILIAYYTMGRSTEKLALALKVDLEQSGHKVDLEKITPKKEHSFLYWFIYRTFWSECEINDLKIEDVSKYDLVCIGTPNWTRVAMPVARYIREVKGLEFKRVATFAITAGDPRIEWYLVSAYMLDLTFAKLLEARNAMRIDSLLLSSTSKGYSLESEKGESLLRAYSTNITRANISPSAELMKHQELTASRLFVVILTTTLTSLLFMPEYYYLAGINFACLMVLIHFMRKGNSQFVSKYVGAVSAAILWTLYAATLSGQLFIINIVGYILVLSIVSIYLKPSAVIAAGIAAMLTDFFMQLGWQNFRETKLWIELMTIILSTAVISITTRFAQKNFQQLLATQNKLEQTQFQLRKKMKEIQNAMQVVQAGKTKTDAIIYHLTDGLIAVNGQNEVLLINPIARELLDCKDNNVDLQRVVDRQSKMSLAEIAQKAVQNFEVILEKDKIVQVSVIYIYGAENSVDLKIILLHDVTQERNLEKMKVDFASIAAHELRTPLTALKGYISMLTAKQGEELQQSQRDFLYPRLQQSSERLSSLIDSLLAVTRIEKGQAMLSLEALDVDEMIRETVQEMQGVAKVKNQTLVAKVGEDKKHIVLADKLKVKEILYNLLTNATRYTQEGGQIQIGDRRDDKGFVEIWVRDNGQGISKEVQANLFQKFVRAEDSLRKETKGVGLGLYLVKSLVEMQHGKIWLESEAGKGSTFYFTLPLEESYGKKH